MKSEKLKLINTVSFSLMLLVNFLSNIIPLGGVTTGGVSEKYPSLFTPAPITFFIWGIIYFFMALFTLYQYGVMDKDGYSSIVRERVGVLFSIGCVLNILWLIFWHFDLILLSVITIFLLLLTIYMIGRSIENDDMPPIAEIIVKTGFDIYFGWLIVASVSNVAIYLVKIEWNRFGLSEVFCTVAMLIVGAFIGSIAITFDKKWLTGLTIVWAYIGVLIRHLSSDMLDHQYPAVIAAAIAGIVILLSSVVIKSWQDEKCKCQS